MARQYDLIVFDWDGTLMDSAAQIVRCFTAAIADVGVVGPGEVAIRDIIGLGLNEAMQALLPAHDHPLHQQVAERYRAHFLHPDQTESTLFPGVPQGLEQLRQQGYLLAIATGKGRRGLDRVLGATELAPLFVATRCADEAVSKPHPQMLHDILDQTGVAATRALMVGDTVYDMQMARNARVDGLAVTYGVHERERLMEHAPRVIVDSFHEVCRWLR
jgi:phosphoglycolate phosphatase